MESHLWELTASMKRVYNGILKASDFIFESNVTKTTLPTVPRTSYLEFVCSRGANERLVEQETVAEQQRFATSTVQH
ncbi:hypothetical protein Y1Q_0015576 [Alligator mississippiensis]|uniref:Uncharacterized protein n=1 Tax=Alligator mississippiensis TaxID=8496 RepID=A0A151NN97_ALLMI|nr:hypothetical protein Y1Q_0015576 [Alligator mississippiensis]